MALGVRTTMYFKSSQGGWSETWALLNQPSLAAAELVAKAGALMRLALCGVGVTLNAVRISDQDVTPPRSRLADLTGNGTGEVEIPASSVSGYTDPVERSADQLQTSILLRAATALGVKKQVWMGGIPDFLIRTNPLGLDFAAGPTWLAKYTLWRTEFQSGRWGFRQRRRTGADVQPQQIVDLILQAVGIARIGITVVNGGPTYVSGQQIQIRQARVVNPALRSINGLWRIQSSQAGAVAGTTVYFLLGSEGISPGNHIAYGTVRSVAFESLAVTDIQIIRQTSHQRGRPFGLYRGRRLIRRLV